MATREIWARYFQTLVYHARGRLQRLHSGAVGDEDIALSTFDCLFRGLAEGQLPDLSGRDELLRLLVKITSRKTSNRIRDENRARRGGGGVVHEGALAGDEDGGLDGLAGFPGREPSPEFAAMVADEFRRFLADLPSNDHRQIAALKMEGLSDKEIADRLGKGVRTVERKLAVIRAALAVDERS